MLFRKKIDPRCAYCAKAGTVDDNQMVCRKKGIVSPGDHCKSFQYDPLKRVPSRPKPLVLNQFSPEDFQL